MPVGIRIFTEPQTTQYRASGELLYTAWSDTMPKALAYAARKCAHWYLAGDGPDQTLYAYDCLGGLRFEARRRNNKVTIKKT